MCIALCTFNVFIELTLFTICIDNYVYIVVCRSCVILSLLANAMSAITIFLYHIISSMEYGYQKIDDIHLHLEHLVLLQKTQIKNTLVLVPISFCDDSYVNWESDGR